MAKYRVIYVGQPHIAMPDCVYKHCHLFLTPTKVLSSQQSLKDWPQPLSYKNSHRNKHRVLWIGFASTDKAISQQYSCILPVDSVYLSQPHYPIFHDHRQPCLNVVQNPRNPLNWPREHLNLSASSARNRNSKHIIISWLSLSVGLKVSRFF